MSSQSNTIMRYLVLAIFLCNVGAAPTEDSICAKATLDVIFAITGASGATPIDFQVMKEAMINVISKMPISGDAIQVGVLQFSDEPEIEIPLNQHLNRTDLISAITIIEQLKGETRMDLALTTLHTMFTPSFGAREDVKQVGILITDGKNPTFNDLRIPGFLLNADGVVMWAIGIEPGVDYFQLEAIAYSPTRVKRLGSFASLQGELEEVVKTACKDLTPVPCVDLDTDCDSLVDMNGTNTCSLPDNIEYAKANCSKFCGYCKDLTPGPCVDLDTDCQFLIDMNGTNTCRLPDNIEYAKANCSKFCGFCKDPNFALDKPNGKCIYKGKAYDTGISWRDNCDYECTCVNGKIGQYECFNRCPVYYGLSSDCTLIRKEGDCCLRPICNFNMHVTHDIYFNKDTDSEGNDVCHYSDKQYYQNEVFYVGCQFQCQCMDQASGRVECVSLCPTYPDPLPSSCKLIEVQGACCKQLHCSFSTLTGKVTGYSNTSGYTKAVEDLSCQDTIKNCDKFGKSDCGLSLNMARKCEAYCGFCKKEDKASACQYNKTDYSVGDRWEADCQTSCQCHDSMADTDGYYHCLNRCPSYDGYRWPCVQVSGKDDCCPRLHCRSQRAKNMYPSTTNLLSLGSGKELYVKDGSGNFTSIVPSFTPSGDLENPESWLQPIRGCLLNGEVLVRPSFVEHGKCGAFCKCVDDDTGEMSCTPRCPTYPAVDGCEMIPSPRDSCCQVPKCPDSIPSPKPTFGERQTIFRPIAPPDPSSLMPEKQGA